MKKLIFCVLAALVGMLISCVSLEDRTMTPEERSQMEVVGPVSTEFNSFHFLHIQNKQNIKNKAYAKLKQEAQKKYSGNIDIMNITMAGGMSGWNVLWAMVYLIDPILFDIQKITTAGDVVLFNATTGRLRLDQKKMQTALQNISKALIEKLPSNGSIAVLSISSQNSNDSESIIDELEYQLVNAKKFTIVDRRQLDQIREEQNFQLSGDVNDSSAVSIGKMLGATIVLTGNVNTTGTQQWLNIKAIDVKTAQIVSMAREQL